MQIRANRNQNIIIMHYHRLDLIHSGIYACIERSDDPDLKKKYT